MPIIAYLPRVGVAIAKAKLKLARLLFSPI